MFLEIIIVILLGVIFGIFTGLVPGVHINLISLLLLINYVFFLDYFSVFYFIVFIISMGITHTFVDFIPSVLFGIPSADNLLSVLPAHKMTLEGDAYFAIYLSSLGSFFAILISFSILPLLYFFLEMAYTTLRNFIPYILFFVLTIFIILETTWNKRFWAFIIVMFSGIFGSFILNAKILNSALLDIFTGLFGVSAILFSLNDKMSTFPKQKFDLKNKEKIGFKNYLKSVCVGTFCSCFCSVSPGIGNAQAATIAAVFFKELSSKIFIIVSSAINTSNFVFGFLTFYLLDRARNGSVFVISQLIDEITFSNLILFFIIIFIVSLISFFITLYVGKIIIKKMQKINFKLFNISILIFLFILVYFIDRFPGILVLISSSALGLLCLNLGVRRIHMMGVLLFPVILLLI